LISDLLIRGSPGRVRFRSGSGARASGRCGTAASPGTLERGADDSGPVFCAEGAHVAKMTGIPDVRRSEFSAVSSTSLKGFLVPTPRHARRPRYSDTAACACRRPSHVSRCAPREGHAPQRRGAVGAPPCGASARGDVCERQSCRSAAAMRSWYTNSRRSPCRSKRARCPFPSLQPKPRAIRRHDSPTASHHFSQRSAFSSRRIGASRVEVRDEQPQGLVRRRNAG
jgi:hypothetical protein